MHLPVILVLRVVRELGEGLQHEVAIARGHLLLLVLYIFVFVVGGPVSFDAALAVVLHGGGGLAGALLGAHPDRALAEGVRRRRERRRRPEPRRAPRHPQLRLLMRTRLLLVAVSFGCLILLIFFLFLGDAVGFVLGEGEGEGVVVQVADRAGHLRGEDAPLLHGVARRGRGFHDRLPPRTRSELFVVNIIFLVRESLFITILCPEEGGFLL